MEIRSLRLIVTDEDINSLVRKYLPDDLPIEDLRLTIEPHGITISGVYPLFLQVRFETQWDISVAAGMLRCRLANFHALGVPANIFKSAIVKIIEDLVKEEPWLRREDDALLVDIDRAIAQYALPARTNLSRVECQAGQLTLFSGP
jgi:hypothetical protein